MEGDVARDGLLNDQQELTRFSNLDRQTGPNLQMHAAQARVTITRPWFQQRWILPALLVALAVPSVAILWAVACEWQSAPSQRSWLILGSGFYIVAALRALWMWFVQACEQTLYLRVELRRYCSPKLFEAVTDSIAKESERLGSPCGWDQEAVQEHHGVTGETQVKLRFWSSRARTLQIRITVERSVRGRPGELDLTMDYFPGENVITGREARVERQELLVLSTRTTAATVLSDKALLTRWLEQCYTTFMQPDEGIVNVYALQESSSDWMPEWKFARVQQCKNAQGTGPCFFLQRDSLNRVLQDARLWARSALRVYMITGPPGVGKSEFTIWLASQLRMPIYRLCLTNPRLTDDRLAQLLSQTAICHNDVLVQVDEFQAAITNWLDHESTAEPHVTPGGFCECLQGSTAMSRGIVVLTGTVETSNEKARKALPAVFRRISVEAELTWMSPQDKKLFFRNFLTRFVHEMPDDEWTRWEKEFLSQDSPWTTKSISVDMLKQYLMHQITESSCLNLGEFTFTVGAAQVGLQQDFRVTRAGQSSFFNLVCNHKAATEFLANYAPVCG